MRYLKEASTFLAFDLASAKDFLRIRHTSEDALITSLIKSATAQAEAFLGWDILDYSYTLILNAIPSDSVSVGGRDYPLTPNQIELEKIHVKSITEVKWVNKLGVESVFDPTNYYLLVDNSRYYLALSDGASWPSDLRSWDSFTIKFKVGYSTAAEIDESIINSIKMILTNLYECRGEEGESKPPYKAFSFLHPFRIWK